MLTVRQRLTLWEKAGGSYADVARAVGVNRATVLYVMRGERRSQKVEVALARVLGVSVDIAFPPYTAKPRLQEAS